MNLPDPWIPDSKCVYLSVRVRPRDAGGNTPPLPSFRQKNTRTRDADAHVSHLAIYEKLFSSTRGRILDLLRHSEKTVSELAGALDLTENAIRNHLSALERDGLVETRGVRREGVGKPARVYGFPLDAENYFPKAYDAVLAHLLTLLAERMGRAELRSFLEEAGHRAGEGRVRRDADFDERLDAMMELVDELGGVAEIRRSNGDLRLQGFSCPLSTVTGDHPEACKLVEGLLSEILGVPVREVCDRSGRPRCAFVMKAPEES